MSVNRKIVGMTEITPVKKPIEEKPSDAPRKFKGSGNILLMDDEAFIRDTVGAMLKHLGYNVYKVSDGDEAINTLEEEMKKGITFKAIILDLTIPNKPGGKETINIIRKKGIDIPAFASSGYSDDLAISEPREFGFTDSLRKPYMIEDLAAMFKTYLSGDCR